MHFTDFAPPLDKECTARIPQTPNLSLVTCHTCQNLFLIRQSQRPILTVEQAHAT